MTAARPHDTELSRLLRTARTDSGVRQTQVAARDKPVSQARLSRIENGTALPSADEVYYLCGAYGVPADETSRLIAMAEGARKGISDTRLVVQRGNTLALQQRWRSLEADADEVRSFQPVVVLGSLQTERYASVALNAPVDSPEAQERGRRRERLARPDRRELLIQTEGSLRQIVGDRDVMREQVDSLLAAMDSPVIDLGIIRADTPMPFLTVCGFHVYDRSAVVIGLQVAAATLTADDDVDKFRARFDRLAELAVWGEGARTVLTALRRSYA